MTRADYVTRVEQLASHAMDGNGQENSRGRVVAIDWDEALVDALALCDDELSVPSWSLSQSLNILTHTKHLDAFHMECDLSQPLHELPAEEALMLLAAAALKADVVAELERSRALWEEPDVDGDYDFTNSRHG